MLGLARIYVSKKFWLLINSYQIYNLSLAPTTQGLIISEITRITAIRY